jgi:hypothetical protein
MSGLTDYLATSVMFNLQILPEVLLSGIILLAILLSNQTLFVLAAAAVGEQALVGTMGRLLMRFFPDGAVPVSSLSGCNSGYIAKSWSRLFSNEPDRYWHPRAPSTYMSLLGFFAGWGYGLQQLYREEIEAGVIQRSSLYATTAIGLAILLIAVIFRVASGCESLLTVVGGLALGIFLGYVLCIAVGYGTDRRATNIWGIPLLRDRINDGKPVYVCTA